MSRVVIAVLLWFVAMATAHSQWRQLPGHPGDDAQAGFVTLVDLEHLQVLQALARVHRL